MYRVVQQYSSDLGATSCACHHQLLCCGPACLACCRSAVYEKHLKTKLKVAVEHFNKDHKKGLQFLQVRHHGRGGAGMFTWQQQAWPAVSCGCGCGGGGWPCNPVSYSCFRLTLLPSVLLPVTPQSVKLMPLLQGSPAAQAALESGSCLPQDIVSEEELAACLGRFLRVCPNLDKVSIGELLGEPADFYIKVRVGGGLRVERSGGCDNGRIPHQRWRATGC